MSSTNTESNTTAPTQFLQVNGHSYAYRRFGNGSGLPLLCLQHFTGTLDNWDPAVTDPLASGREVILFDNAGVGRSTGDVPETIAAMTEHSMAFLDGLGIKTCDVLGFSLGGVIAQQIAQDRPSILRRMVLVGTAPRGGEDIMHLEKPSLAKHIQDPQNRGYALANSWSRQEFHSRNWTGTILSRSRMRRCAFWRPCTRPGGGSGTRTGRSGGRSRSNARTGRSLSAALRGKERHRPEARRNTGAHRPCCFL